MCGIIGIVSKTSVADRLVDGLRRMEYRGYDSAGICTQHDGALVRRRAEGRLANLVTVLGWQSCDHTGPVYEGDTLYTDLHIEAAEELGGDRGGVLSLRSLVSAAGDGEDRPLASGELRFDRRKQPHRRLAAGGEVPAGHGEPRAGHLLRRVVDEARHGRPDPLHGHGREVL